MTKLNVKGIDKLKLIEALWQNQKPAGVFGAFGIAVTRRGWNDEDAKKAVSGGYIDYFSGRAIKMDLSGDEIDPELYNRDAPKPALFVVEKLRAIQ